VYRPITFATLGNWLVCRWLIPPLAVKGSTTVHVHVYAAAMMSFHHSIAFVRRSPKHDAGNLQEACMSDGVKRPHNGSLGKYRRPT